VAPGFGWRFGFPGTAVIRLSERDWHGLEEAMLHEMAHVVVFASGRQCRRGEPAHGPEFYAALRRVIATWYGDERHYGWHNEYRCVWEQAYRDGLTEQLWFRDELRRRPAGFAGTAPAGVMTATQVSPGQRVIWTHRGVQREGVVLSAYAGCRARVRATDGRHWYVPQPWLQLVVDAREAR
jgi:hypothetical protein